MAGDNRGSEIKNKIAKGAATVAGGPAAGEAVDLALKAKLGPSSINKNADLLSKQRTNLESEEQNLINDSSLNDLPKEGLEDGNNISSNSALGKFKNRLFGGKKNESAETNGSSLLEVKTKDFFKKHKFKIIAGSGILLMILFFLVIAVLSVYSTGGIVKQLFSKIGDHILGFSDKVEERLAQDYIEELEKVKNDIHTATGGSICIDENLITATLMVDVDARKYVQSEDEEKPPEEDPESGVVANQTVDYQKMTKEIRLLANMQIKHNKYGLNKELVEKKIDCPEDESIDERVKEENLDNLEFPTWWAQFIKKHFTSREAQIEKYVSDDPDLVSRHDLTGFRKFFTKKVDEEKNFEYHIYTPKKQEICESARNGQEMHCNKVCNPYDIPKDETPELSIGNLKTMEQSVYYWNLVNAFIPEYYEDYLPPKEGEEGYDEEKYNAAVKRIAEDIYLLYADMGPGETCHSISSLGEADCTYAYGERGEALNSESGSESGVQTSTYMKDVSVQLTNCNSGTNVGMPMSLEDYVRGVTAAEISSGNNNYEAVKAQAIMARTYVLSHANEREVAEDGTTVLKIGNCQTYQVYTDPTVKFNTSLETYEKWNEALDEVRGMVLTDANGNLIQAIPGDSNGRTYYDDIQNKWMNSPGDYRSMLMETYGDSVDVVNNCTFSSKVSTTHASAISGMSVEEVLAQYGHSLEELNNYIAQKVASAGVGTRAAVVAAARALIEGYEQLTNGEYKLPYKWGGTRTGVYGAVGSWYKAATAESGSGLDCSGFISWALYNGGYTYDGRTSGLWDDVGTVRAVDDQAQPGDLVLSDGHVMMIVGYNESGTGYAVAHASSWANGLKISEMGFNDNSHYILDMSSYYATRPKTN